MFIQMLIHNNINDKCLKLFRRSFFLLERKKKKNILQQLNKVSIYFIRFILFFNYAFLLKYKIHRKFFEMILGSTTINQSNIKDL